MKPTFFILFLVVPFFAAVSDSEKIQELKKQLRQEELKETNEEVKAEKYMLGDWNAYSKSLEKVDEKLEKTEKLKKEIQELEQKQSGR